MYDPSGGFPSTAFVRSWIGVPATVLPDEHLDTVLAAEQDMLFAGYDWGIDDLPPPLVTVFLRLVARAVAAKGVPLGILAADAEYGTVRLGRFDSEVTRLGGPYRKRAFA
jgi:hypothetical protein